MITDAEARFSNAQAITTGVQYSTNSYYRGLTPADIGSGQRLKVVCTVTTTFAGGTSLVVDVVESDTADLSVSPVVVSAGAAVVEATLIAGYKIRDVVIPKTSKPYYGLRFTTVGTHSAGAVFAAIVEDTDSNTVYAANTGF